MNPWNQIPFLRLLLPFLIGIIAAIYHPARTEQLEYILVGLFILIALFSFIPRFRFSYKRSWIFGSCATVLLFLCGYQVTLLNTEEFNSNHFSNYPGATLFYVKTDNPGLEKENSFKIPVSVMAVNQKGKWTCTSGKAICYFKKDSLSENIRYGDCLVLGTKFTEIKPPQNPSEFNYKRFLFFHNIYHQAFVSSQNWVFTGINQGNRLLRASLSVREYLLNIYKENNIKGDEYAVGSALVLGYTDKLDQDLISAYAGSGALHVLSVSGLHVGIIYLVFNYLLFFLDKFRSGKFIKMALLLSVLWFYAILTGLSPSVLRSAAMFSFVAAAKTWRFNTAVFNTLAVSCFFLLLYNPYFITDVGFQLSYLAVAGIITLQSRIYEKWQPGIWIVDQVWLITSVSLAAQLITFPLGLLYFHQFPNYFLLSNLIVIPVSTLILGYGLLMFILGKFSAIGIACGKLFSGLVWLLNESVRTIDQAPGALLQGISTTVLETCLIYLFILFLILSFYKKQATFLFISLTIAILLFSIQILEAHSIRKQKAIIVYNIPGASACDFINGKETVLLADSLLVHDQNRILFHIRPNWWNRKIIYSKICNNENPGAFCNSFISVKNNFIQFQNKRIALVHSLPEVNSLINRKLSIDLVVLSKNPTIRIGDLQKLFDFKKIIFDSSNPGWEIEKWKQECARLKIDFYSVPDSGAYLEEI